MKFREIVHKVFFSNLLIIGFIAAGGVLTLVSRKSFLMNTEIFFYYFLSIVFLNYILRHIIYFSQRILAFIAVLLIMILFILRELKYSCFTETEGGARFIWYLYYIPIILIPLFLFYSALAVDNNKNILRTFAIVSSASISLIFITLICTNDLHQWIFVFRDNFENWDSDYGRTPLFYVIAGWLILVFLAAYFTMIYKCSILLGRHYSWLVVFCGLIYWVMLAVVVLLRQLFPTNGILSVFEFQEFFCAGAISFLLTSIRLWLIPTDNEYNKLSDAIAEINEQLAEETELNRLRNELKSEQITVAEKNSLYDKIAEMTAEQSANILKLSQKKENLPLICVYGVYIKRISNLMLIASEQKKTEAEELVLSVKESAKYLSLAGIPAAVNGNVMSDIPSEQIITVYQTFEKILEKKLTETKGVLIHFYDNNDTVMKFVLEGVCSENQTLYLRHGVYCSLKCEDNDTYVTVSLARGGEYI